MKRLLIFAMSLMLVLTLGACKVKEENSTNNNNSSIEEQSNNDTNKSDQKKKEGDAQMAVNYPQLTTEVQDDEKLVEMETTHGNIKIKLFPTYAPKAVENFITHSENGYYEGIIFHRVIEDFMIQGGDPTGTGGGGESIWGSPFEDEFSEKLFNMRGSLSMANAGPGTNGSQFFIVQNSSVDANMIDQMESAGFPKEKVVAYAENGGTPWLDSRHTVFGQVVDGMDVVDKIAAVEVGPQDKPLEDVVIKKITVLK